MPNISIFDFCETLVDKQTGDAFVEYVLRDKNKWFSLLKYYLFKTKLYWVLSKCLNITSSKVRVLGLLKGMPYEYLDGQAKYYCEGLINNHQTLIVSHLLAEHAKGHKVFIVSGGYSLYLKYFFPDVIDHLISSDISFTDGICDGKMVGLDCLGLNKIIKLKQIIGKDELYQSETTFYSDHHSDLPLLLMVDNGIAISDKVSQKWARKYGLQEIILNANK